jgi:hypothetical protein
MEKQGSNLSMVILISMRVLKLFYVKLSLYLDGVPPLLWEETLGGNYVLIYEKKGLDVQTLFKQASNHFTPITTAMIFHLSVTLN